MPTSIDYNDSTGSEIAVIGMAGRFPAAKNINQFWENLKNGVESISFFSDEELTETGIDFQLIKNPNYVKARGGLEAVDYFNGSFFGYTPLEVEIMAPQMRIFHECAWEALEDAGYDPNTYSGLIGLYVGAGSSFYWESLTLLSGKNDELGQLASTFLSDKDFLSTRIAYKLNLKGPVFSVQTACSTSLVAIHLACQALLNGECEIALAGGVTIFAQKNTGYLFQEDVIFSPDGHCRTFDARAKGTVSGSGAGVVVLKPLEEARLDRDVIHAVVKGTAINNDGTRKIGYTAPAIEGQAQVIRIAHQVAEVEPESFGYVETHGSATELGDPVEIEALKLAFNTNKKGFCGVGSIKTNIGHLDTAAGVAGFIKTVLALKHKQIPPSLHFENPNPRIDFENSPFYVNTTLSEWKTNHNPLRAGVSSFGIGGTNAHVVLEEWSVSQNAECTAISERHMGHSTPGQSGDRASPPFKSREYQLILLSAKTQSALDRMTKNLTEYLKENSDINIADAAFTLQVGRRAFQYRRTLVCANIHEAVQQLSSPGSRKVRTFGLKVENPPIIFMFAGLGSQYVNMGRVLYEKEPVFQREMDRCFEILDPLMDYNVKEILYPSSIPNRSNINQPEVAQVVIFILEYALAKLIMKWGIHPCALIGYSFGEYIAACISGVFTLEVALKLIVHRGKLIKKMPKGAMLSVPLNKEEITPLLNKDLSLAIDNGASCIIAGSNKAIDAFEERMKGKKYICMRLSAVRALHSTMMAPISRELVKKMSRFDLKKPQIPFISNVTGNWVTHENAINPEFWAKHLKETVQFATGLKELLKKENAILVEIGPGNDLSALVQRYLDNNPGLQLVNMVRHPQKNISDVSYLLDKIGRLWLWGAKIDWHEFYTEEKRHRIPLPTYPFEPQQYRPAGNLFKIAAKVLEKKTIPHEKLDIADWFYIPSWKPSLFPFLPVSRPGNIATQSCWLIFIDESEFSSQLVKQLKNEEEDVYCVKRGTEFMKVRDFLYTINPQKGNDYDILLSHLHTPEKIPGRIIHLWGLTKKVELELTGEGLNLAQEFGIYSLLHLIRAIARQDYTGKNKYQIKIVTNNMQKVPGEEVFCPGKATVLAPVKMIPREYPNIKCTSIDIVLPNPGTWQETRLRNQLLAELRQESCHQVIVYRGNDRLVQVYEPMPLPHSGKITAPLKKEGVYLLVGCLKGIGFKIAEYLAKTLQPKLVFIEPKSLTRRHGGKQEEIANNINLDLNAEVDFLIKTEERIEKQLEIKSIDCYHGLEETINALCTGYIWEYFKSNFIDTAPGKIYSIEDLKKKLKLLPKFNKFFDFFIRVLREDKIINLENNKVKFLPGITKVKPPLKLKNEAEKRYPQFKGILRLIEYCVNNYTKVLRGEIEAISILYPGGIYIRFDDNYHDPEEHGNRKVYALLLQELVFKILRHSKHKKKFRILEIGGGNGFLTRILVPILKDQNVEYHFTDLGNFFVLNAKKEAAAQGFTFMKFSTFDITKEPTTQGYERHSFDMIVGLKVIYTTKSIEESIRNLKQLLVPNGIMCLIEATNPKRWVNMIEGLANEWWNFEDKDIRPHLPLLSLDVWEKVLQEQGFRAVTAFPGDQPKRTRTDLGLIIAQQEREIPEGEIWQVKNTTRDVTTLERFGAKLQVINADAANQRQMQEALAQAEKRLGKIRGVIYCVEGGEDGGKIENDSKEKIASRLTPSIRGVRVLEDIFKYIPLDFFVICSTRSSPGASAIGSCAVNSFLDSFAHYKLCKDGWSIMSINWDSCIEETTRDNQEEAMSTNTSPQASIVGIIFERILNHTFPQIIVSKSPVEEFIEGSNRYNDSTSRESLETETTSTSKYQRPELTSEYVAPGSRIEQTLVEVWQEFLGIAPVGIVDDFFELGADSLIFIAIASKIQDALKVKIPISVFHNNPTIKGLAEFTNEARKAFYSSIEPMEKKEYYTITAPLKKTFKDKTFEKTTRYNMTEIYIIEGKLDRKRFNEAIDELFQRHEAFRTSFHMINGKVVQRISDSIDFKTNFYKCNEKEAMEKIKDFKKPFDLTKSPLFKAELLQIEKEKFFILFDMHHAISDGISMKIMFKEFASLYEGRKLEPLVFQFRDYAVWQDKLLYEGGFNEQERYWLEKMKNFKFTQLPPDNPNYSSARMFKRDFLKIESSFFKEIEVFCNKNKVTKFIFLIAIFKIILFEEIGQEDITIGTRISIRDYFELENIIGYFLNVVLIRSIIDRNDTFLNHLLKVDNTILDAMDNSQYPYELLEVKIKEENNLSIKKLFTIKINYVPPIENEWDLLEQSFKVKPFNLQKELSKYDISLGFIEFQDALELSFFYDSNIYHKKTIKRMCNRFFNVITRVVKNPGITIDNLYQADLQEVGRQLQGQDSILSVNQWTSSSVGH